MEQKKENVWFEFECQHGKYKIVKSNDGMELLKLCIGTFGTPFWWKPYGEEGVYALNDLMEQINSGKLKLSLGNSDED